MSPTASPHIDADGNFKHGADGSITSLIAVAITCRNCGFLREFVLNVDELPEARFDPLF